MTANPTDDRLTLDADAQRLLFTEARTANSFTDEPVTEEQLRAIYDLTRWAPTSANTQPLRVLYVDEGAARERLLPHMSEGNRAKTGSAPMVAVLAADLDFHEHIPAQFPHSPQLKEAFDGERSGREQFARFNAALQAGYLILGIRAAGLHAGPMLGYDAEGIDREFFPDGRLKTILVINIGRPGENPWFDRLPRLDYDQVVRHV